MITVTQNADGSLFLPLATSITVKQIAGGMTITANDTLAFPVDGGPVLAAKIAKAKINLTAATADVAKASADLV